MKRIAFLVSGGGTNMQAVLNKIQSGEINALPVAVISSNPKAYALERAKEYGIKSYVCRLADFESKAQRDEQILKILIENQVDLVVLAGFLGVLSPLVVRHFDKRIINIHPALLPNFGGKGFYGIFVHEAVLKAKQKVSGATAHFVDSGVDTGEIICQRTCPVLDDDTAQTLAQRVLTECEYDCLCEAVRLYCLKN